MTFDFFLRPSPVTFVIVYVWYWFRSGSSIEVTMPVVYRNDGFRMCDVKRNWYDVSSTAFPSVSMLMR